MKNKKLIIFNIVISVLFITVVIVGNHTWGASGNVIEANKIKEKNANETILQMEEMLEKDENVESDVNEEELDIVEIEQIEVEPVVDEETGEEEPEAVYQLPAHNTNQITPNSRNTTRTQVKPSTNRQDGSIGAQPKNTTKKSVKQPIQPIKEPVNQHPPTNTKQPAPNPNPEPSPQPNPEKPDPPNPDPPEPPIDTGNDDLHEDGSDDTGG